MRDALAVATLLMRRRPGHRPSRAQRGEQKPKGLLKPPAGCGPRGPARRDEVAGAARLARRWNETADIGGSANPRLTGNGSRCASASSASARLIPARAACFALDGRNAPPPDPLTRQGRARDEHQRRSNGESAAANLKFPRLATSRKLHRKKEPLSPNGSSS